MDKKRVAIDIDEILRSKSRQFHRYYVQEFGEEGVPENPFILDFFKEYKWNSKTEKNKIINPDIDTETIPPEAYVTDENGVAPVDLILFNTETRELTEEDVFNRFMYQDFVYEIFGAAPKIYRDIDVDLSKFIHKYEEFVEFTIISKENYFSTPATLFFLSKIMCRVRNYFFFKEYSELNEKFDLVITTDPNICETLNKESVIKLERPYNKTVEGCALESLNLIDLYENNNFENLINNKNE